MLLHPDEIKKSISTYGWNYQDGKLNKSFEFDTYMDGIEFVTKIAPLAEKLNHHPDLQVGYCKIDIAISYQPQLHMQVDQGLPLIRVGTLIATPLNCLLVLNDSEIKNISDLKGKKIGYSVGGFEDTLLKTLLNSQNLLLSDV